jgi:hypothetical protein
MTDELRKQIFNSAGNDLLRLSCVDVVRQCGRSM